MSAGTLLGKVVRLVEPESPVEESARFTVVEDNGDRIQIELICDLPIKPIQTVATRHVVVA